MEKPSDGLSGWKLWFLNYLKKRLHPKKIQVADEIEISLKSRDTYEKWSKVICILDGFWPWQTTTLRLHCVLYAAAKFTACALCAAIYIFAKNNTICDLL